jgi:superfamily I DNA/RNA helicase
LHLHNVWVGTFHSIAAKILRFEKEVIRLEQNYRSTARILKAADSVILNNKERHF